MSKHKRLNPAYLRAWPEAWIFVAKHLKLGTPLDEQAVLAPEGLYRYTNDYRYELRALQNAAERMRIIASERLPKRETLRQVPFYLRQNSVKYSRAFLYCGATPVYTTFIPSREYAALVTASSYYEPIVASKATLHEKRFKIIQKQAEGLIRWPETMRICDSTFTICKTFDDFSFKIDAGTRGNVLPTTKCYGGIKAYVTAPREFFDNPFWGLGEHLVVRIVDAYHLADGTEVLKTFSCDRMDLYDMGKPNVLHVRYYVRGGGRRATGLTEASAIRSLGYFMGKEIAAEMGV